MHEARIEHDLVDHQQHDDSGLHAVHELVDRIDVAVDDDGLRLPERQREHLARHQRHGRHEFDGRDGHRLDVRQLDGQHVRQRHDQLDGIAVDGRRVQLDRFDRLQLVVDDALMALRRTALALAVVASLGLAACHRGSPADEHATSSARAPKGTTGAGGTSAMGGPGAGLSGGLAPSGSASEPTGVSDGSTNRTPRNSVGNR